MCLNSHIGILLSTALVLFEDFRVEESDMSLSLSECLIFWFPNVVGDQPATGIALDRSKGFPSC